MAATGSMQELGECQQPRFSVVVPCYNDGDHLRRCLASILAQTLAADEIVVVDDGSTDTTAEVCTAFAEKSGNGLIYHYQDNAGVSAARNRGIELASGNYLVFVDADDELDPGALVHYAAAIAAADQPSWLIANHRWERNGRVKARSLTLPASKLARFKSFLDKELHLGNISNMCFAKTAFAEIRFPEELRFGEDTVVFAIMLTHFDPVVVPHIAALAHRRVDSLRSRATLADLIASNVHGLVFNHPLLPDQYQGLSARHWARHSRSIMRQAYRDREYSLVVHWYRQMVTSRPTYALDVRLFFRYLQAQWKA